MRTKKFIKAVNTMVRNLSGSIFTQKLYIKALKKINGSNNLETIELSSIALPDM
jgi:hypothetical protein